MSERILSLSEASRGIRDKQWTSRALVESCLKRIEQYEPSVGSIVTLLADHAKTAADAADADITANRYRGALHGIPYTLKDIIETKGVLTSAHSRSLAEHIPKEDAEVQKRLAAKGGVLLAKAATWEFAHGGPSWDILQAPARNPWKLSCDPSGSSSGSAAGVAAGFSFGSIGTDTGGSIRGPAAACGVTGLKPTFGRVSRRGVIPNSYTHDHVGPIAWSAGDVAILLQSIAGYDALDPSSVDVPTPDFLARLAQPLTGLRIGVPYHWFEEEAPASAVLQRSLSDALRIFERLGAKTMPLTLPPIRAYEDAKKVIAAAELFNAHQTTLRTAPDKLGEAFRVRVFAGGMIDAQTYINAHRLRSMLAAKMQDALNDVDVIVLPTAEPAKLLQPNLPEALFERQGYLVPFCVSGNPALATRAGFTSEGMPLSLQIVGKLFDEATVLNVAHQYEMATDWRHHRPTFRP